jgi:hypothetical protein
VSVTEPASVSVVSTKEVVIVPAAIVPVPFVTGVPLGLPALSVSIRNEKVADGDNVFFTERLNVVPATPLQNTGNEIRVLPETSPRFCTLVANANVGDISSKTACPAVIASQAGIEESDIALGAICAFRVSLVTNLLLAVGVPVPARASFWSVVGMKPT